MTLCGGERQRSFENNLNIEPPNRFSLYFLKPIWVFEMLIIDFYACSLDITESY